MNIISVASESFGISKLCGWYMMNKSNEINNKYKMAVQSENTWKATDHRNVMNEVPGSVNEAISLKLLKSLRMKPWPTCEQKVLG